MSWGRAGVREVSRYGSPHLALLCSGEEDKEGQKESIGRLPPGGSLRRTGLALWLVPRSAGLRQCFLEIRLFADCYAKEGRDRSSWS